MGLMGQVARTVSTGLGELQCSASHHVPGHQRPSCCAVFWDYHEALPHVPAGPNSVVGVIPEALKPRELSGETIGELHTTQNMHQRKVGLPEVAGGLPL